jgi:hypothetical protein
MPMRFVQLYSILGTLLGLMHIGLQTAKAQNQFFIKGGTTLSRLTQTQWSSQGRDFAITSLLWGGGLGIEKQFSDNCTFSMTLEYLSKGAAPESEAIVPDLARLETYNASKFITSTVGLHSEVRFYSKSELQGFFLGLGFEIGGIHSKTFVIQQVVGHYEVIDVKIGRDFAVLPNLSLGTILPVNADCAVEISSGVKVGTHGLSTIPLLIKLKYSL